MTPSREEALRALRMAERDIVAFSKMKNDPDFHFSTPVSMPSRQLRNA